MGFFTRGRSRTKKAKQRDVAMFEFSRRLVGANNLSEIADAFYRAIDELFVVDTIILLSIDDDYPGGRAVGVSSFGATTGSVQDIAVSLTDDDSAISRVIREGAAHRILNTRHETLHNKEVASAIETDGSALYVPLQTGDGVIAVAVLIIAGRLHAFRRDEVDIIQKLANDAAVAIERARFAQQLRDVGERDLIVASVARAVRESLDPNEVLTAAATEVAQQTGADQCLVAMRASQGVPGQVKLWSPNSVANEEYDERLLPASAQLAIGDQQVVTAHANPQAAAGTELAVPLCYRDTVNGVLVIERSDNAFTAAEIRLVELIAIEVAAAIEHVRLYQVSRRHLEEQVALARAAQSLTADLRFDRVLEHIVDEVVKLLRTESASFYVYDRESSTLTLSAGFGAAERQVIGEKVGLKGLAGRVVQSGVSQLTNNYQQELGGDIHPAFRGVRRAMAVPVRWQGDLRGVISVADRDTAHTYTEHEQALLEAFADLASLALHNADAYSAHSKQARIQAGFYRISQILSSSLSRTATLAALAQAATEVLDGDWAVVIGGDGALTHLHLEGSWQAPDTVVRALVDPDVLRESPADIASHFKRVVTSRNVNQDERFGDQWRKLMDQAGVTSQLAVPVQVNGEHSATVLVCFSHEIRFGDEELVVANNLTTAASAALERAGLFENERRTRRLSEVLADVSALIAETLKAQTVLDRIVHHAATLLEVDACALVLTGETAARAASSDENSLNELHVHSAAGADHELVSALLASPIGGLVEEVARTRSSVSVAELASEGVSQSNAGEAYDGFLGVPLRHPRGHLIGVLSAYSRRSRAWSSAEITSLESFASSAAIAIRNAELYDDIRRERERLQILLESIGEGIVATDANGKVLIWNRAASELTKVKEEDAVGRQWRDVIGISTDVTIEDGQNVIEVRPTGAPMFLSVTSSRLTGQGDNPGGWIHAFRDVSATYTLDRLKSDFVSTVSYVLRTPIASIYGFANTLLRDDLEVSDEDKTVFLQYIATETDRLKIIVDDLLEVSSIDAGSVEITPSTVSLHDAVQKATAEVQSRGTSRPILIDEDDPLIAARADSEKLHTVLGNLIDNAVRMSDQGEVLIELQKHGERARIIVHDTGGGMSPSEQQMLFTKFYISPRTSQISGSGLGLYISKGLVDAMGGQIWVSSRGGEGSSLTVELPAASEGILLT